MSAGDGSLNVTTEAVAQQLTLSISNHEPKQITISSTTSWCPTTNNWVADAKGGNMRYSEIGVHPALHWGAVLLLAIGILMGCRRAEQMVEPIIESTENYVSFPEFFLEKGVDEDSSYIALRGIRTKGGILELQATSWGIRETGLFLARERAPRTAVLVFMGECGTVSTTTWQKVTLRQEMCAADQDTVDRILFRSHGDTLEIVRTRINVVPDAINYPTIGTSSGGWSYARMEF
jgi:hypothetical protein